jgi:hypothetical protein
MVPCLLASLQGAIRLSHLLQRVIKSSTRCMSARETSTILLDEHMVSGSYHVPFFLFQKVPTPFSFHPSLVLSSLQVSESEQKTVAFQQFCRQLYHACLVYIYSPLRPAMTIPEVVQCPDGHFRHSIFSIGPYIADYPEQVWLACIIQNWCPK